MRKLLLVALTLISIASSSIAQEAKKEAPEKRVHKLAARILKRLPDRQYTAHALGRGVERDWRAFRHAAAIYAAADAQREKWREIAQQGEWQHFNPEVDLAPLIAAVAFRESSMREVVRLDGGEIISYVPIDRAKRKITRSDIGVMQVRAPSRPAFTCGVERPSDVEKLLTNIEFSYKVGTCILTNRIAAYAPMYKSREFRRFKDRSKQDQLFYGFMGERKDTIDAKRARELIVIERYNWGGSDLYDKEPNSGYARRVLREFEFFREGLDDNAMYTM